MARRNWGVVVPPEPLIDPQRVTDTFDYCLWHPNDCDGECVHVEGIRMADFDSESLARSREEITALLDGLPVEFKRSGGGGWTFLNACNDANGVQWTGLHQTVEKLFLLGMGIGRVTTLMPREVWPALPGGVPYYVVEDLEARDAA
jgi:hypothetical protein